MKHQWCWQATGKTMLGFVNFVTNTWNLDNFQIKGPFKKVEVAISFTAKKVPRRASNVTSAVCDVDARLPQCTFIAAHQCALCCTTKRPVALFLATQKRVKNTCVKATHWRQGLNRPWVCYAVCIKTAASGSRQVSAWLMPTHSKTLCSDTEEVVESQLTTSLPLQTRPLWPGKIESDSRAPLRHRIQTEKDYVTDRYGTFQFHYTLQNKKDPL